MAASFETTPFASRSQAAGPLRELGSVSHDDVPAAPKDSVIEKNASSRRGAKWAVLCFCGFVVGLSIFIPSVVVLSNERKPSPTAILVGIAGCVLSSIMLLGSILMMSGLFQVQPNEVVILQWFGEYAGTVGTQGLRFVNPFYEKTKISMRLRTMETKQLKVNDKTGTPVEIGAIVVWRVTDTARAKYNVDDFTTFVFTQAEAALRSLALLHPYDVAPPDVRDVEQATFVEEEVSLRGHAAAVAAELREELQRRVGVAGVEISEARISHLAYAPEIAHAMLQRQQASAVIAARRCIVEGAVGILQNTVEDLESRLGLETTKSESLDVNRLVTNLLTVLVSQDHVQPVISTGC
jgi:regulator of protease activity HflC (stomatin/prohibitin superfamily)